MLKAIQRPLTRVLWVCLFLLPLIVAAAHRVPDMTETPTGGRPAAQANPVPIEFNYLDYPGSAGPHRAEMLLRLAQPDILIASSELRILVADYETNPSLNWAQLRIDGTECAFATKPRSRFPNNAELAFERGDHCQPLQGHPTGTLTLSVSFDGAGRLGVWAKAADAHGPEPAAIYLADPLSPELIWRLAVQGRYVNDRGPSRYRRIDVLNYLWQISPTSLWLWSVILIAGVLLMAAALLIPSPVDSGSSVRIATLTLAGSLGLALLYVILIPPFQAPDEPSHFLGFGYVTGERSIEQEAAEWSYLMHFQRIRFQPAEKFRPANMGHLDRSPWEAVFVQDFARSSITVPLWRFLHPWLAPMSRPEQLLALRFVNLVIFCVAMMAATALTVAALDERGTGSLPAILLVAPALPFFATHVSNYGPATSAYVLIGCAVLILVKDGPRSALAGLPLGCGLALAIAATRSALPMAWFVGLLAVARICLGTRGASSWRPWLQSTIVFWAGIAGGALLFALLLTEWQALAMRNELQRLSPAAMNVLSHVPQRYGIGWIMAGSVIAGVEVALYIARAWYRRLASPGPPRWARWICLSIAFWLALSLLVSAFTALPVLVRVDQGPSEGRYVWSAVASMATPFRLRFPDPLLSWAFWAGFGWLDTVPGEWLIDLLSAATGVMAILRALRLARDRDVRRAVWAVTLAVAFLSTVAVYADMAFRLAPDLHGRYLIGAYLPVILVSWSFAFSGKKEAATSGFASRMVAALPFVVAAIGHSWCLQLILVRYF